MRIQGPNRSLPTERVSSTAGTEVLRSPDRDATTKVRVSKTAELLQELRAPEMPDESRIEALKDAIRRGNFKIDPERIASAMLNEEMR